MTICFWPNCGGWIKDNGHCGKCGRSTDIEHEQYVAEESKKEHRNIHTYSGPDKTQLERRALAEILLFGGEV